jgi:CBS domain-containing protein
LGTIDHGRDGHPRSTLDSTPCLGVEVETMRVSELMQPEVWTTYPEECLADAAIRMRDHAVGSLAVVEGDELLGILTERDLMWAMADGAAPRVARVGAYMSAPPIVATPDTDIVSACRLMVGHDVRHLPVAEAGELKGMISARDLLIVDAWREPEPAEATTS